MTGETNAKATAKRQTRKKAGRKPGQQVYSQKQRGVALTIVDLFDGNVARAAQATGIERKTLFTWRQELEREAVEMQKARTDGSLNLVAKLKKLAETLCAIALMKAQSASVGEIRQLIDVILDKIERLSKVGLGEAALGALLPTVGMAEPLALPPSIDSSRQKAHWESIVQQVIQQSADEGTLMTREEAISGIVAARPEAKDYLM
jgi:hypothetical protein